jgi:hypothetical protein
MCIEAALTLAVAWRKLKCEFGECGFGLGEDGFAKAAEDVLEE